MICGFFANPEPDNRSNGWRAYPECRPPRPSWLIPVTGSAVLSGGAKTVERTSGFSQICNSLNPAAL
jgi:hypothetical protein